MAEHRDFSDPAKPEDSQPIDGVGSPLTPVGGGERIEAIDVLRGFALLGILVMNIPTFALSPFAFFDPRVDGGFEGADFVVWLASHLFFELKMMAIFSMLFGAGIILLTRRAEERGRPLGGVYYRRIGWLLCIGLIHAYFVWEGDILVLYAICGALLFPVRRLSARLLIPIGLVLMLIAIGINVGSGFFFEFARTQAEAVAAASAAGEQPTEMQLEFAEVWEEIAQEFRPTEAAIEEDRNAFLGDYLDLFPYRAEASFWMQTQLTLIWGLWRVGGLMMLGMGLFKLGVFSAVRSNRFYLTMSALGYGIGLPIVYFGSTQLQAHEFDFVWLFKIDWYYNYVGSIGVALGHVGVVMLVCRQGALTLARHALAAVGRMALTNYLMQSLICAIFFYGWGFGQWGSYSRWELMVVVAGIWSAQLVLSPLWLSRFRFGPMEWLWRSLTYWRIQPMVKQAGRFDQA